MVAKIGSISSHLTIQIRLEKIIVSKNHEILISATNTGTNEGILYLSTDSVKSFSVVKIFKVPIISTVELGENIYVLSDLLYEINRNNYQMESKQLPIKATYTDMFLVGKDSIWLTGYTGNPIISKPEYKVNSFLYTSVDNGKNWIKNNYEIGIDIINKIYFIDKKIGFIIGSVRVFCKNQ
jgi:hypothetical protein